jgi:hypothetical protein
LTKHFIVGFRGYSVNANIEALIRDYYVGYISDSGTEHSGF